MKQLMILIFLIVLFITIMRIYRTLKKEYYGAIYTTCHLANNIDIDKTKVKFYS